MGRERRAAIQVSCAMLVLCFGACRDDGPEPYVMPSCDEMLVWEDHFLAETQSDLEALAPYSEVTGDLTITGSVLNVDELRCLERVGGFLYLSQGQLEELKGLSNLSEVGSLYASEMPNLRSFEGLEEIRSLGSLTVQLSGLQSLLGLSGLESIAGRVHIHQSNMPNFRGLDSLLTVGGNFTINGYMSTLTLEGLESLESIGGSLDVQLNSGLESMEGLSGLRSIGGDLRVVNNAELAELGLAQLSELGRTLTVRQNASLPNCQALALRDVLVTAGWVGEEAIGSNSSTPCD